VAPAPVTANPGKIFVGLDLGTSGCRACALDAELNTLAEQRLPWHPPVSSNGLCEEPDPRLWWQGVVQLLMRIGAALGGRPVAGLAVDGTSATMLAVSPDGEPLGPALMYNDRRAQAEAERIALVAPPDSACSGSSSGLAKLLHLQAQTGTTDRTLAQADWIAGRLLGRLGVSDANNALKLGFDPGSGRWPAWLDKLGVTRAMLPEVYPAGTDMGEMAPDVARLIGWPCGTRIVAGSTDSVAATLASGIVHPGEAVTALGSTLVLKIVTPKPVFSAPHGVYSHRVAGLWLAGGASNSGGAVLTEYFSLQRIGALSQQLVPERPTGLDLYPLAGPGERFPHNDPTLVPRLEPRPRDDRVFFQAMLEGMARIERDGYELLARLGAPAPVSVRSTGGGAANEGWRRIRERILGVPVLAARWSEACYGAALLARHGCGAGPLLQT
jgi:sugar (pentulose or hexulose) kinase